MDQMPSMEHLSGSVIGVGSLPGQRHEEGIAMLPDERKTQEKPHRRFFSHRKPPPHDKQVANFNLTQGGGKINKHDSEEQKSNLGGLETGGAAAGGRALSLN
jgi:hypothetical protein